MSKKKGSGNTMTLKDFHGGSIPTDLPLPSAPGVIVRPSDRPGYDRPNPWGNPMGRPDHRSRPHSSPATRHFDDKTPFLAHAANIGRNFDEDERKPLDGVSAPRRTISDDNIRVPSARVELKPEYGPSGSFSSRQGLGGGGSGSGSGSGSASGNVNSIAGKVNEAGSVVGVSSQNLGGNSGGYTNVWAARKEAMGVNEPVQQAALSGQNAVSKFAHASALDKVSSGRWQSKQPAPYQGDVEAARSPERESGFQSKNFGGSGYDSVNVASGREYHDATLARQAERGLNIEDGVRVGRKEFPDYERAGAPVAPVYSELKERNPVIHVDRTHLARNDGKLGGSELHSPVPLEPSERPKLKLLPRTKPLESSEQPVPVVDHTQGYQRVSDTAHTETVNEVYGNMSPAKPSIASTESVKQVVERPKLNLKPRSQPAEHLEGNAERERNMLFGGARPRELSSVASCSYLDSIANPLLRF